MKHFDPDHAASLVPVGAVESRSWDATEVREPLHEENTKNLLTETISGGLPEEFLHEAVEALNPAVLGWLDGLRPVRDEGQHRSILPIKHTHR